MLKSADLASAFLYENKAPGLEEAAVVTMATRVLHLLKEHFCAPLLSAKPYAKFEGGLKIFISQDV